MRTVVFALLALVGLAACGGDDPPEQPDAAVLLDAGPTKGKRDCPHGYSGEHCEQKVVTCGDNPCDRGVCVDYGNSYECECRPGWSGVHCTVNKDDCAGVSQCGAHGACVDGIGGYTCACRAGWTGPLCDQNIDDCANNPCKNGGTCLDGVDAYSCRCDEVNWTGPTCAIDIDRCAGNNACGAHGTCQDTAAGFECECAANWYGADCSLKQDYCASNDCQYGDCVVLADSYKCDCQEGWEGSRCEQKVDPCSRCTSGQVCKANSCVKGVVVPKVTGLALDPAGDAIVHAKLQMPVMPDFTDQDVPLGEHGFVLVQDANNPHVRVLEQRPAPGTLVAEGTPVALRVAIPPDDDRFLQDPVGRRNDSDETAEAYYNTIDVHGTKDTLTKWIAANGFNDPNADTAQALYQNTADLGFVRDMHMAKLNGRIAFYVKNHPSFGAFRGNEAAKATVAMEYGSVNGSAEPFVTFYTFGEDGKRIPKINLDGGGDKSQPGVCLTCHGGFSSSALPQPGDNAYPNGGDTGARFIPFDLSLLAYENNRELGSTRAAQEGAFRKMNFAIKESYGAADLHAKQLIDGWYASGPTFNDAYVPPGWTNEAELYTRVVKPNCRLCHSQQTGFSDFGRAEHFLGMKDQIIQHVFERSSMPLARRTFYDFWVSYPNAPAALAAKIGGHPRDGAPVTGYLVIEFPESQKAIADDSGSIAPIQISPTKAAFLDTIDFTFSQVDTGRYRLTRRGPTDVLFEVLGTADSSDLVTVVYNARGKNGELKTGSFDVSILPSTKKLSFFGDGFADTWQSLPCALCHKAGGRGERAYIVDQPNATIETCLTDPTADACSQTFVSKLSKGDGKNSRLIRVPLERLDVTVDGATAPHPFVVEAGSSTESGLLQLQRWIDDGALP